MITEAGTTKMEAAALMRIWKLRDRFSENEIEVPSNAYSVFRFCANTQNVYIYANAQSVVQTHAQETGSGISETTLTRATRGLSCNSAFNLSSGHLLQIRT